MKKSKMLVFLPFLLALSSCGGTSTSENPTTSLSPSTTEQTTIETTTSSATTSSTNETTSETTEEIDRGKVYVNKIVAVNGFGGIKIRPRFTKPEYEKDEHFEYNFKYETDNCYIDNDTVYYVADEAGALCNFTSEHFSGRFNIACASKFPNSGALNTAKSLGAKVSSGSISKGTTLFVGDSYFEFWRNGTNGVENFATSYADYNVANVGISGTTSTDWRAIQTKLVTPVIPKNIVLNIGINDIDDLRAGGTGAASQIQDLLLDIRENLPSTEVYLMSLLHCTGNFSWNWNDVQTCNEKSKEFCEQDDKLHFLDVTSKIGDNYTKCLVSDGLHPNQNGFEAFKEIIAENVAIDKK